jgi:type IV secretion system protein TrbL
MGGTGVIDSFLGVFTSYIDSGFGLLGGEVAFIATTLIVIDVTLAALFWSWGADDDIMARLVKKTLFVGVFAYIIGNWNNLARIVFESFAGLGLQASGTGFSAADLMRPGRVAQTGLDAGRPLLDSISDLMGYWAFFENFIQIACLLFAWALVILAFFILAVQLFVTLIEFKLTTLAGFVLIPFGLFGKTAFMAERVLGNVVSSGIKVLVLAVIIGIGSTLFGQFTAGFGGATPTIDEAMAIVLAALSLLGLGIFGPGIASGLVSGGPQLGAGAAVGTGLAAGGMVLAGGAAVGGSAMLAAKGGAAALSGGVAAVRGGAAAAGATSAAYSLGSVGQTGTSGAASGLGGVARAAGSAAVSPLKRAASKTSESVRSSFAEGARPDSARAAAQPQWARLAAPAKPRPHHLPRRSADHRPGRSECIAGRRSVTAPPWLPMPSVPATATVPALPSISPKATAHEPLQTTIDPLRQDAGARDPIPKGAQAWDERIGSARVQARNWRLMAFGCLFLSAGFALRWSGSRHAGPSCPGSCRSTISARRRRWRPRMPTIGRPNRRSPSISAASSKRSGRSRPMRSSSARTGCGPTSSPRIAARRRSTTTHAATIPSPRSDVSKSP